MSTLNFEVGKAYQTRDGRKAVCLTTTLVESRVGFEIQRLLSTTDKEGNFYRHKSPSAHDIVSEWVDKPVIDWDTMPAWAKFVAMDKGGKWYLHTSKPLIDEDFYYWKGKSDSIWNLIPSEYAPKWDGDWRNSLIERP
jgi:hypothetical protein